MNRYIVITNTEEGFNAANKARKDVETIADRLGYIPIFFNGESTAKNPFHAIRLVFTAITNWIHLSQIAKGSTVLIQYPHYPLKTTYLMRCLIPLIQKIQRIHFIFLIHDLNSLRGTFGKAAIFSDNHLINCADTVICHNEKMQTYLEEKGIPSSKLKTILFFDYLTDCQPKAHHLKDGITIAGNLDPEKSGYIDSFIKHCSQTIPVHLYGKGLKTDNLPENVIYHGAYPPDILPGELEGAFGIVWDGPSIETCEGRMGEYLKYNTPHKASLYLASGIPVIIWSQAAIAETIEVMGLGRTITSLEETETIVKAISSEEYKEMCGHIDPLRKEIIQGTQLATILNNI